MKVRDLPAKVTASKADWLAGTTWLGFTPTGGDTASRGQCQSTIKRQFGEGYVIEYITQQFSEPNPGFETDPQYVDERAAHLKLAGRFIAIHKLKPTARSLEVIIGPDDYKHLQDMWAQNNKRLRWSVAFPIIESYEIIGKPKAKEVLGDEMYRRLYQRPSATLRVLEEEEQIAIADLEIQPVEAFNAWIALEDEYEIAEKSELSDELIRQMGRDLDYGAFEGETEEHKARVRRRAAWLANKFAMMRKKTGRLICDDCGFDPVHLFDPKLVSPRSMFDVHHKNPLRAGKRYTTINDYALLCPTCHRAEHRRLKNKIPSKHNQFTDPEGPASA